MDVQEKIKIALAACKEHEEDFSTKVPKQIIEFWQSEDAFQYNRKCLPESTELPGFDPGSFRLVNTVPSWSKTRLDDAVVGPDGDWEHAGKYLPLFMAEQSRYIVLRLDDPNGAVGWFEEETWDSDAEGYRDGVYMLSNSLEDFLKTLVDLEEAEWETDETFIWEGI